MERKTITEQFDELKKNVDETSFLIEKDEDEKIIQPVITENEEKQNKMNDLGENEEKEEKKEEDEEKKISNEEEKINENKI